MPVSLSINEAVARMGDKALYLKIASAFAAALPETLVSLEQAIAPENLPNARRFAHSLKSNCAAIGAVEIQAMASALEKACAAGDLSRAVLEFSRLKPHLYELRDTLFSLV